MAHEVGSRPISNPAFGMGNRLPASGPPLTCKVPNPSGFAGAAGAEGGPSTILVAWTAGDEEPAAGAGFPLGLITNQTMRPHSTASAAAAPTSPSMPKVS